MGGRELCFLARQQELAQPHKLMWLLHVHCQHVIIRMFACGGDVCWCQALGYPQLKHLVS
jgi:hypothetical protein